MTADTGTRCEVKFRDLLSLGPIAHEIGLVHEVLPAAFYRAMHFSAKRGIAIACRPSTRP